MKLTIPQPDLIAAINRVRGLIENQQIITVLGSLEFEAHGETLAITATDLSIQATARVSADTEAPGVILIEGARLFEFLKRIPADRTISIEAGDNGATIKAGRSRATLATIPTEQFPEWRDDIQGEVFELEADQIRRVLFGPMPAVADDEIRYYLSGVYLHTVDSELRGVATDGHKLIKISIDRPEGCNLAEGIIIPDKALTVLAKCLGEDPVQVMADSRAIRFSTDAFDIQSRLIDSKFPDYQRIVPDRKKNPVTVHRDEAIGVAERVASIIPKKADLRSLVFQHDQNGILVRSSARFEGEADDIILAETAGEFPDAAFDAPKFTSLLGSIDSEMVTFHIKEVGSPHLFTNPDRPDDVHILMPVRAR